MYKCLDCGNLFEEGEAKRVSEKMGEAFGSPAYQDYYVCPCCGGDFEEVEPCKLCGSYEHIASGEEYCTDCKNDVLKRFQTFVNSEFTEEERELLNELYEGEQI